MPDIEFACPKCQQTLEAPPDMAGETVECPNCQAPILIPKPAGPRPAPKPAVQPAPAASAAPPAAENACPECGAAMEPGTVLCVACGYHLKLRKKIQTELS